MLHAPETRERLPVAPWDDTLAASGRTSHSIVRPSGRMVQEFTINPE
jgi:hypothetical protein